MRAQFCKVRSNIIASKWIYLRSMMDISSMIVTLVFLFMMSNNAAAQVSQSTGAATAPPSAHADSTSADVGDPVRGKQLFVKNLCYSCHGYYGQGGSYTGPRIAPDPLPWEAIAAFIRNPRNLNPPYTSIPFGVMPPYISKNVSDKDVQDIVAYLKSVPAATDIKNIPTYKK